MRSFLALDLTEDLRGRIAALQSELRVGRKPPEENLHLTLAFLDDQPEAVLRALHDGLAAEVLPSIRLRLHGLETFGGARPRLLYLKADGGEALLRLHRLVRRAAQDVGIDLPRERFRPHVTLARFRRDMIEEDARKLGAFMASHGDAGFPEAEIAQLCLFRSTLHEDGAVHEVLADYPLG